MPPSRIASIGEPGIAVLVHHDRHRAVERLDRQRHHERHFVGAASATGSPSLVALEDAGGRGRGSSGSRTRPRISSARVGHEPDAEVVHVRAGIRERRQHQLRRRQRERALLEVDACPRRRAACGSRAATASATSSRGIGTSGAPASVASAGAIRRAPASTSTASPPPGAASTLREEARRAEGPSRLADRERAPRDDDRVATVLAQVDASGRACATWSKLPSGASSRAHQHPVRNAIAEVGARGIDVDQRDRRHRIHRRGLVRRHHRRIERMREREHDGVMRLQPSTP